VKAIGALLLLLHSACAPANLSELRCEGEAEMKKLTAELKKLETFEDVQKASKKLKRHFSRIADLLIETRHFPTDSQESSRAAEELFVELARIYEIPGARKVVELAQSEAVRRLDRPLKPF